MHPRLSCARAARFGIFLLAAFLWGGSWSIAQAQTAAAQDVFVVRGVSVDETAESTAAARAAAHANGKTEAARRLFERLTRGIYRGQLGQIDAGTADFLVDSLEVANERRSDVRYLADLTVTFRPAAVRQFLQSAGIPFTEVRSRPVLIVPILDTGDRYVLWEDPNPWREAWRNHPSETGLVPVVTPLGDLSDLSGLSAEQAVDFDIGALGAMADRYGARTSVVAVARISGNPETGQRADVSAIRVGRVDEDPIDLSVAQAEGEAADLFLERVTGAVIAALDDDWKAANAISFAESGRLHAAVPLGDLAGWIEVQRRLANVPAISTIRVLALTADTAEIELDFFGDTVRLASSLDRFDLVLEETGLAGANDPANVVFPPLPTHVIRLPGT
ncbi:MAG: DUF2066 domain-containing protein [Alphaproteobacteria bacterium]|nr:DUF2066 domain-containing protein [Alphaproteobacteria bacterium]